MFKSIVVIDNDVGVVNAFKTALARCGFDVVGFVSFTQGFEALKQEPPQAVILGIEPLKPQSISLLRETKKMYPVLPVITMTAYSTSFTEADAIRDGADGYFVKPIDLDALIRKLQTVTNTNKAKKRVKAEASMIA